MIKKDIDKLRIVHLRYQQYYKGVRVVGAEFLLHGRSGNIETMNGHHADFSLASVSPKLNEKQSLAQALSFVKRRGINGKILYGRIR